ncbi:hypothetical protein CCACVL1_13914 [Corchorus capsularis]|uniref:Uncharacterized protein n=1 Tax=Corchorus capsularis TaxID=210143 RepID=A0A1R3I944_COCAP|nr:hypothetical protein CCACVL1_13914 [Corchorus capsularis]
MYMEEKQEHFCQSGRNNNANENLFTVGMLLLMVCLKIALLLFLVEQWRAWVFLVLNIVLLAIFFTSSSTQSQESKGEMKKRGNCRLPIDEVEAKKRKNESSDDIDEEKVEEKVEEEKNNEAHDPLKLSKEELNERVEAFIAMFRQQLASDARKGRENNKFFADRKQADMKKPIKLSSHGVNCFVLKVQG